MLGLIGWALGIDPSILIGGAEDASPAAVSQYQQPTQPRHRRATGAPTDQAGHFVAAVLGNTEDTWTQIFPAKRPAIPHAAAAALCRLGAGPAAASRKPRWGRSIARTISAFYLDTSFFRDIEHTLPWLQRQGLRVLAGLRDRARGRPSRAEPARHLAEGAGRRSKPPADRAEREPHSGARRVAGRLLCRRLGQPSRSAQSFLDPGDIDAGAADRDRDRRRHACSGARKGAWCRIRSRTARPSSASAGS